MIIGIDPSLSGTAVCLGDADNWEVKRFTSTNIGNDVANRMRRYEDLVNRIVSWINSKTLIVDAIYLEGYSFGSKGASVIQIAEYGSLIRWHIVDLTSRIYEVAPTTLKKFAVGVGKGDKSIVTAALAKRYNVMFTDNDSFDAFGLHRLGLVAEGIVSAETVPQQEAVDTVLGRAKKPKAKRRAAKPDVEPLF